MFFKVVVSLLFAVSLGNIFIKNGKEQKQAEYMQKIRQLTNRTKSQKPRAWTHARRFGASCRTELSRYLATWKWKLKVFTYSVFYSVLLVWKKLYQAKSSNPYYFLTPICMLCHSCSLFDRTWKLVLVIWVKQNRLINLSTSSDTITSNLCHIQIQIQMRKMCIVWTGCINQMCDAKCLLQLLGKLEN